MLHQTSLRIVVCCLIAGAVLVCTPPCISAAPGAWGSLEPGPHAIGFKTIEKYDYSRAYAAKRDYFGDPVPGERARPLQIAIWYPAVAEEAATPMGYGEYTYAYPGDQSFAGLLSQFHNRELGNIMRYVSGYGAMADVQNLPLAAVKDASPAKGPFPLLLYCPHAQGSYCENTVMCEYLASHGFIVATTHPLGTSQLVPHVEAGDLTTMVRDMAFVKGVMHDFPEIDPDRLGLFGWGLGSVTALWTQMQDSDVDAMADLGGGLSTTQIFELIRNHPYFDRQRMRAALLELCPSEDAELSSELVDSLIYAERLTGVIPGAGSNDFSQYPTMASLVMESSGDSPTAGQPYALISQYVLEFFKEKLINGEDTAAFPDSFTRAEARPIPPTPEQFVAILQTRGAETAIDLFEKFRAENPNLILFQEPALNMIGYRLLQAGQTQNALAVFKMNRDTYPSSANTWDSYAEACVAAGERDEAVECFRKALALLETDTSLAPQFRDGIRQSAEQNLEALEQPVSESHSENPNDQ